MKKSNIGDQLSSLQPHERAIAQAHFRTPEREPVDRVRQIGLDDRVDLNKGNKLFAFSREELVALIGRPELGTLNDNDHRILAAAMRIRQTLAESCLDEEQKKSVLVDVHHLVSGLPTSDPLSIKLQIDKVMGSIGTMERQMVALKELEALFTTDALRLQKPTGSVFYKAIEAQRASLTIYPFIDDEGQKELEKLRDVLDSPFMILVVEHNWAGAFAGAGDFDLGEFHLPHGLCCFEFQINGMRIALAMTERSDGSIGGMAYFQTSIGWAVPCTLEFENGQFRATSPMPGNVKLSSEPLFKLMAAQIRAISIGLEAEVTTTEIVRTPHKLNQARERKGKRPLLDYHIVSLARRARSSAVPDEFRDPNAEPGTGKRVHFRRGHNRHYPTYKIWIKWQLVGNPDLGFIDKHYKL